jgi:hypothetical protein
MRWMCAWLRVLLTTGIMAGAIVPQTPAAGGGVDRDEMMPSGGRERTYHVHVPAAVLPRLKRRVAPWSARLDDRMARHG